MKLTVLIKDMLLFTILKELFYLKIH